jgi:16S rRNA (guanine527-N7)-methyltransferase
MLSEFKQAFPVMTDESWGKFEQFYEMLVAWNEKLNLTAIVEESEVFIKHFYDSLLITQTAEWKGFIHPDTSVIDVGTGAGFPGIPLAICYPQTRFVLCDALNKRLLFLEHVCAELGLDNVELVHSRAEDLGHNPEFRQSFDGVVSRAVARLPVLAELTVPLAKISGHVFAYKGPSGREEIDTSTKALRSLGATLSRVYDVMLPGGFGERTLVVLAHQQRTPDKYPRKAGMPQRKPLE